MAISQREVKPGLENQVVYWQKSQAETCPDMLVSETLREALWFEVNPPLKDSAQETLRLCGLRERLKTLLGSKPRHPF